MKKITHIEEEIRFDDKDKEMLKELAVVIIAVIQLFKKCN